MYGSSRLFGTCDPHDQSGQGRDGSAPSFLNPHLSPYVIPPFSMPNAAFSFHHAHNPMSLSDVQDLSCGAGQKKQSDAQASEYLQQVSSPMHSPFCMKIGHFFQV